MLPSAADVPVPTRGFRGGEKGRRAHHSFWSILWFKMKLFNLSTRPTSFPPHPGPALGKWLFCLNSVGRASHTGRFGGPGGGREMLGCPSPIFSGCCCFSPSVSTRGASLGALWLPVLFTLQALLLPKPPPHPPSLPLPKALPCGLATGHTDWSLPCSLAQWAGRRVEKGLQPPSGRETSCNPGHLMLLLPCARESLGEAGMEASFLSCP